jgi:transcription elongation factor SPT6
LKEKPADRFTDYQYLLLDKAEKEGLVEKEIVLRTDEIKKSYEQLYLSDNFSMVAEKWNEERRKILKIAFEDQLFPLIKRWLHDKLLNEAMDAIVVQCQQELAQVLH